MKTIKILMLLINLIFINNILSMSPQAAMIAKLENESRSRTNFIENGIGIYLLEENRDVGFKKIKEFVESDKYSFLKLNGLPTLKNSKGQTLLYLAIEALREDIVQLLLENEESIYNIDNNNGYALEIAQKIKDDLKKDFNRYSNEQVAADFLGCENKSSTLMKSKLELKLERINKIISLIESHEKMLKTAPKLTKEVLINTMPKELTTLITSYLEIAQPKPEPETPTIISQQVAPAVAPEGCGTGGCVIA